MWINHRWLRSPKYDRVFHGLPIVPPSLSDFREPSRLVELARPQIRMSDLEKNFRGGVAP